MCLIPHLSLSSHATRTSCEDRTLLESDPLSYLPSEHYNYQGSNAQCYHSIKPDASAVFAVDVINPVWNTISCEDDGESQDDDKGNP